MSTIHACDCPGECEGHGLSRRHALAGAAATGIGASLLAACGGDDDSGGASSSDSGESESGGSEDSGGDSGGGSGGQSEALAATSDIPEGGGMIFEDAAVVVTQPAAGTFMAFSTTCTHKGCPVNEVTETINCPCHGSKFSLEDGSPVGGPATKPLEEVTIQMDGDQIVLG